MDVTIRTAELEPLVGRMERTGDRVVAALVVAAMITGGTNVLVAYKDRLGRYAGPLVAGGQGLKYFTFRNAREEGFIPVGRRESMRPGPKRHAQSQPWASHGAGAVDRTERHELIAPGEDGLAAPAR